MGMPKISLAGFKDPVKRPRYIIWTGVLVLVMASVVIVALGATSTYWFCGVCHDAQADTIATYDASSHNKVSCMACHMPVNADPITYVLHKMTALGELYLTVTEKYEIPLNKGSHLSQDAHHMGSEQCTQCHSENRIITPSDGIIIDHVIHEENSVHCTLCHNRVAHPEEDVTFVNTDPATGELNSGHPNFMEMTACFRCHSQEADGAAPGACSACHPADFELKPANHFETDFYPHGHAELAVESVEIVEASESGHGEEGHEEEDAAEEGHEEEDSEEATEATEGDGASLGISAAFATESEATTEDAEAAEEDAHSGEDGDSEHGEEWELDPVDSVFYCYTCHKESFCTNCHGMEMPHPQEFIDSEHPEAVQTQMDKCVFCHQPEETGFCDSCHHGTAVEWEYDPADVWQTQHADAVVANGTEGCLDRCHETNFCYDCHNELKPLPGSHKAADWLRKPAEEVGVHADSFNGQPTSCEICHGEGMPNKNTFCRSCHVLEMPHPQDFKEFHAKTGRDNPTVCANCHTFKELCSDCHHEGAVDGTPWLKVHGPQVNENGADNCFEQCHEDKNFCVSCHTTLNVVPASHNAAGWTNRLALTTPALHPQAYDGSSEGCTYCHGEGGPEAKFCMDCHGLAMPHPDGFGDEEAGGQHADGFAEDKLNRASCETCHVGAFCNECHHGYTAAQPWVNYHPNTVKEDGAEACFDCHEETYCSYCHVREASKYINN